MKKIIKKLLSVGMAVLIVCSVFPYVGFSVIAQAGKIDCFSYSISDTGEVTITSCDKTSSGEITVPDEIEGCPVTTIQRYAFQNCINVTGVILPETLEVIGEGSFFGSGIESIVIPDGVSVIPGVAFKGCKALASVELPEGIVELGLHSLSGCSALTEVILPESLRVIRDAAFFECKELVSVNLPAGLTEIGADAFNGCIKLASDIVIPEGVTKINSNIFRNCYELNSLTLHDNITEIGAQPFLNCNKLQPIRLPENLVTVGSTAFYFQDVQLPLPSNIEAIGYMAFYKAEFFDENGEKVSAINIPEKVKTIGKEAFSGSSVAGESAYVSIPASVESIGVDAFNYPVFDVDPENVYYSSDELGVLYDKGKTNIIRVPYHTDKIEYVIPDTVTTIEPSAFGACVFSKIIIPASVISIGDESFRGCAKTVFEVDEDNLYYASDEKGALYDKNFTTLIKYPQIEGDTDVVLPESVEIIEKYAFYANKIITSLTMGDNVVEIKERALSECDNLQEVHFSVKLEILGDYVFCGTNQNAFTVLDIPDSVTYIGSYAFSYTLIQTFTVPAGVTVLEGALFSSCGNLESVVIHEGVTDIEGYAFQLCSALKDIYYCGSSEEWESITISENGNSSLTNATIHYNYGKISGTCGETLNWSFDEESKVLSITGSGEMDNLASFEKYGWSSLKDQIEAIEFGNAVVSVGSNAFAGCPNLKEVYLSESIGTIGGNAFADCPSLSLITVSGAGFTAEESSFSGNDERLIMLYAPSNTQAADYAAGKLIGTIPFSYDYTKKVMNFNGELTVYPDLPYLFLSKLVKANPTMEYLYFEKLVFHGVEPETFDVEELGNDKQAQYLTFNNLYLSLKKVKDGSSEGVKFSDFLTLLENGDYDSFMFELKSDEGKQQLTFKELWEKVTDHFVSSALRITSKIINFFRKIFR